MTGDDHRPPGETLALFADCLLVGLMALVAALGVLTAYLALVAACALLRDRVSADVRIGPGSYWIRLRQVAASGPAGLLAPPAIIGLLGLDAVAVAAGAPGGRALAVGLGLVSAGAV
ncbi:MAG: hypothetical protein HKP61_00250, partial [Dactylosporangium sp.]|nr:hypothetical protein [Dactylosporangium sp.]NNJ59403.1 hypothetical protein [Dactylosporangium sp.]